ncbi:carbon-nitrogen hydrolase family protein [Robiginitalea sp. IMCC44478]|uniref:carbon-nitrogen hydrolase family protein n=1 Tax=Robiginitalea sp. IMCC44478 TaxID=3459122 RepID=UPI00404320FE
MKIGIAQIEPIKGHIQKNIEIHKRWVERAVAENVNFLAFPELSLTGYEPALARQLAIDPSDSRLDAFQKISDRNSITIGLGAPTKSATGIRISMIIFQPKQGRKIYSKQRLHPDELPYFEEGDQQLLLTLGNTKIAPGICYESLQRPHAADAKKLGADIYLASVAKSEKGVEKAFTHYPAMAREFNMPVLMCNCFGFCDTFQSGGSSAVWNARGDLLGKLETDKAGMLILDMESKQVIRREDFTSHTF